MLDKIDFLNSVKTELEKFTNENMKDIFKVNVWTAFNHEDVRKIFDSEDYKRVTFHYVKLKPQQSGLTISNGYKAQKINIPYDVYTVIDDSVEETDKRDVVLDRYSNMLKSLYDNYSDRLCDGFYDTNIDYPTEDLTAFSDNLYAIKQRLNVKILKKV